MPDLDPALCRARQARLLQVMQEREVELAIVTQHAHVQWLTGAYCRWTFQPTALLTADGHLTLVSPAKPALAADAADEVISYQAKRHSTMRNDQRAAASEALLKAMSARPRRLGVEFSSFPPHLSQAFAHAELIDLEVDLFRLRRRKDADELAMLRTAIAATQSMYQRAREIIAPGVSELTVFNELQAAAVHSFGEMLTGTGNDYQCNSRGGPPRDRQCEAGELYILDLGPAYRGYFADNARTIAVSEPTEEQLAAWEHVTGVLSQVERTVRPGMSCRALFEEAQAMLDDAPHGIFNHHLGHGIGLFPHEGPHLNPNWDDTFAVGDVFTAEPGLYAPELKAGMRIENDYLVTETGVENLCEFALEL
jgi:Xaa-Pro dipeptidase